MLNKRKSNGRDTLKHGDMVRISNHLRLAGEIHIVNTYPYKNNAGRDVVLKSGWCVRRCDVEKIREGTMSKYDELKHRINSLGEDCTLKEVDDIMRNFSTASDAVAPLFKIKIPCNDDGSIGIKVKKHADPFPVKHFEYDTQCTKFKALKAALHWMLDNSRILKPFVGETKRVEIEGKVYKAKILEEIK